MVNITPASTPIPAAVIEKVHQEREALRRRHGVRLVQKEEEGEVIKYAKGGIYGFTYAPQTLDAGLFSNQSYLSFEMHKLGDNSVRLLAAVTPEMKKKIETADSLVEIEFFPEPYSKATELIVLAYETLRHPKPPSRDEGNKVKAFYQPA